MMIDGTFYETLMQTEVHPAYLSDNSIEQEMGAIIREDDKKRMLPFLKSNFGKLSEREMARRLNVGKTTSNRWCREMGLVIEKNTVNEHFFREWNSNMAYILGFAYADGNINWKPEKSYRCFTITSSEKDKNHLENIRSQIKSTKNLLYAEKTKSYRLIVNSTTLCEDLMKIGLTPKKSLTVKFPKIPQRFLKDFIRGVIDGDGTVRYVQREKSPYFEVLIFSGSREFLEVMKGKISSVGIDTKLNKVKDNVFTLRYTCKRGMKLAEWIYGSDGLRLERKFQHYKTALRAMEVICHE